MLSVPEAAKILNLSRQRVNHFYKSQAIPTITVNRKRFASLQDVEIFAEYYKAAIWLKDCLISGELIRIDMSNLYLKDFDGITHKVKHHITDLVGYPFDQMWDGMEVNIYPVYQNYKKVTVVALLEA
jgi:hypothetical protein